MREKNNKHPWQNRRTLFQLAKQLFKLSLANKDTSNSTNRTCNINYNSNNHSDCDSISINNSNSNKYYQSTYGSTDHGDINNIDCNHQSELLDSILSVFEMDLNVNQYCNNGSMMNAKYNLLFCITNDMNIAKPTPKPVAGVNDTYLIEQNI